MTEKITLPYKVIVDSNILYVLYGSRDFQETRPYRKLNRHKKMIRLFRLGLLELCITPQIFKEFTYACRGLSQESTTNFDNFIKDYIHLISFNPDELKTVEQLTQSLGNDNVSFYNLRTRTNEDGVLFPYSHHTGQKNWADTRIMAEATVAGINIVTLNVKDFSGHPYIYKVSRKYGIMDTPVVYDFDDFLKDVVRDKIFPTRDAMRSNKILQLE